MDVTPTETGEWMIVLRAPPGYQEAARLDVYVTRFLPNASRAKVQAGIRNGQVHINGRLVDKPSYNVQANDEIRCRLLRPPPTEAAPEAIALDIVYEDASLIVVNKPAGMVVHPAHGNQRGTLVNALLHHVGGGAVSGSNVDSLEDATLGLSTLNAAPRDASDPVIRPGIIHRIDKNTSGLLVVAKDDQTHRMLARQFERHTIRRRYMALVWGVPDPPTGTVDAPIGRDPRHRKRMAVVEGGKRAVTHYTTLRRQAHTAMLDFQLETGRTHQIRVHARHIGHPIFGDMVYEGDSIRYGPVTGSRKAFFGHLFDHLPRQALHAYLLGFQHPATGEQMDFSIGLPADIDFVIRRIEAVER